MASGFHSAAASPQVLLFCTLPGFLFLIPYSQLFSPLLLPPSPPPFLPLLLCSLHPLPVRTLVPRDPHSQRPTAPWSPLLPPHPPSHLCPLTAPPGYAAWAWMRMHSMRTHSTERYSGMGERCSLAAVCSQMSKSHANPPSIRPFIHRRS